MDLVAAIQHSIDIAGKLRALTKKIEDADFTMLVADLSNGLADAKLEVANLKGELAEAKTNLLTELQGRLGELNAQNEALRTQLVKERAEVDSLNSQVKVLTERLLPTDKSKLDEPQEGILLILAQHEELEEGNLASLVGASKQLVAYHVEELRKRTFAYASHTVGSDWNAPRRDWSIQQAGREYLVRRGMLG